MYHDAASFWPNDASAQPVVLHLFSGPADRPDGLAHHLSQYGIKVVEVDKDSSVRLGIPTSECDLAGDALWQMLLADLAAGKYAGLFLGTPCDTFSAAKSVTDGGPRPLRTLEHLYGLPRKSPQRPDGLSPKELELVKQGTYFAVRSAEALRSAAQAYIPTGLENPRPWDGKPSLFLLQEFVKLLQDMPWIHTVDFDQCVHGAETTKPTRVIYANMDLSTLSGQCHHPPKWHQFLDLNMRPAWHWGPHPPLKGRRREDGSFATKSAAAYPSEMYSIIADSLQRSIWERQGPAARQ